MPLEQMVERFPNWGYQLFFREKSTNAELEKKVSRLCIRPRPCHSRCLARQLPMFFKLIFRLKRNRDVSLTKWTLPGGLKKVLESEPVYTDTGILTQQVWDVPMSSVSCADLRGARPGIRLLRVAVREEHERPP